MNEIVTGAGPGAVFGPHVRGWNVDGGPAEPIPGTSYFAYGTLKWGVNVACGDLDGDGYDEIVTGAGPGAVFGPHVRGWNVDNAAAQPIQSVSFFAYGTLRYGVNVACGDIDGDGRDEILTGPGPSSRFGAHVRGWRYDGASVSPMPEVNFFAYYFAFTRYGVRLAAADIHGDGIDEIITIPGPDGGGFADVLVWRVAGGEPTLVNRIEFDAYQDLGLTFGGTVAGGYFNIP
jgi:fibronectin-binding autotransporter adhesin